MVEGVHPVRSWVRQMCTVEHGLLAVSLVAGAFLLSAARASPGHAWLGWFCLFPLFVAIRVLRPGGAAVAGVAWGFSLCVFLHNDSLLRHQLATDGGVALAADLLTPAFLTAITGLYACAASWLTHRIGFSPFVMGAGWLLVELLLAPTGLRFGLLASTQSDAAFFPIVAHAVGYVFVAFLCAYVCALLVTTTAVIACSLIAAERGHGTESDNLRLCVATWLVALIPPVLRSLLPRAPPALQIARFL